MKTLFTKAVILAAILATANCAHAFYNPELGRWLNRDPIAEQGGYNLFRFVSNDPVAIVDTFGLAGSPPIFPPIYWPPTPQGNCDYLQRYGCRQTCEQHGKVMTGCWSRTQVTMIRHRVWTVANGWIERTDYQVRTYVQCQCDDPLDLPPPPPPCTIQNAPPPIFPPPLPPHSNN